MNALKLATAPIIEEGLCQYAKAATENGQVIFKARGEPIEILSTFSFRLPESWLIIGQ